MISTATTTRLLNLGYHLDTLQAEFAAEVANLIAEGNAPVAQDVISALDELRLARRNLADALRDRRQ